MTPGNGSAVDAGIDAAERAWRADLRRILAEHPAAGDEERACDCGRAPGRRHYYGCPLCTDPPASAADSDNAAAGGAEGLAEAEAVLAEHWFHDGGNVCECGYWAEFDSVKRHHIEDALAAHVAQAKGAALADLATRLRKMAVAEFDKRGPHDPRGAAIWDVAAFIAEDWLRERTADRIEGTR